MYLPSEDVRRSGDQIYVWASATTVAHLFSLNVTKIPALIDGPALSKVSLGASVLVLPSIHAAGVLAIPTLFFLVRLILYTAQEFASEKADEAFDAIPKFEALKEALELAKQSGSNDPNIAKITSALLSDATMFSSIAGVAGWGRIIVEIALPAVFGIAAIYAAWSSIAEAASQVFL